MEVGYLNNVVLISIKENRKYNISPGWIDFTFLLLLILILQLLRVLL